MGRPVEETIRRGDEPVPADPLDPLDLLVHDGEWTLVPRDVDEARRTTAWLTADERAFHDLERWR